MPIFLKLARRYKMTVRLVLCAMLFAFFAHASELVMFSPERPMLVRGSNGALNRSEDPVLERGNGSALLIRFDCGALNQIPQRKLEKISFSFSPLKKKGGSGVLEFRPLKKTFERYRSGEKTELSSLADLEAPPLFTVRLSPKQALFPARCTVELPANEKILSLLNRGFLAVLNSREGTVSSLTISGFRRYRGGAVCCPFISIEYSTPAEKLKFSPPVRIESGKFVTKKGADFFYNGKKLNLFGVNIGVSFRSHGEADQFVDRLLAMNVNAVRAWLFRGFIYAEKTMTETMDFIPSRKGDNSFWDCADYFFARLQKEGIFVDATFLMSLPDLPAKDQEYWFAQACLNDRFKKIRMAHIRRLLNRVNPYTGQRYAEMPVFATWELQNELGTVPRLMSGVFRKWSAENRNLLTAKWNAWLLRKYRDASSLRKAWGALPAGEDPRKGTVEPAPVYGEEAQFPKQRGVDFLMFVESNFIETNLELERTARACAPEGIGIRVSPIIHTTHTAVNLHGQYADAQGDFNACGIYQTPYTKDRNNPFYPYSPFVSRRPYFHNINFQASARKPFMIYEYSFHRPYRFRVEFVPVLAMLGGGLGWDAMYLYTFNVPTENVYGTSPLFFSGSPLANPAGKKFGQYTASFRSASDEVVMAPLAVMSQAFRNGIAPNRAKTKIVFGRGAILDPRYRNYGPKNKSASPVFTELVGGGVMEYLMMPGMYRMMIDASVRTFLTVDFDLEQAAPIRISGRPLEKIEDDLSVLTPSPDLCWNPKEKRAVLDNLHSKVAVGILPEHLEFRDGVSFRPDRPMFGFFGMSTRDGKSPALSKEILFASISEGCNTGYRLNPEKMTSGALALIPAIEDRGRTPVIVTRPSGKVRLPGKPFTLKCYNFAGYCYRKERIENGTFTIQPGEPLFLGVITR